MPTPSDRMKADISFVRHLEDTLPGYGLVGFTDVLKTPIGTKAGVTAPEHMNDDWFHLDFQLGPGGLND